MGMSCEAKKARHPFLSENRAKQAKEAKICA